MERIKELNSDLQETEEKMAKATYPDITVGDVKRIVSQDLQVFRT